MRILCVLCVLCGKAIGTAKSAKSAKGTQGGYFNLSKTYFFPLLLMIRVLFLVASLLIVRHGFTQISYCDSIPWSGVQSLSWNHFRAAADSNSAIGAMSNISYKYKLEIEKNKIFLVTGVYFHPCASWYKISSVGSLSLEHEQTHFNIDELVRRTFNKDVLGLHHSLARIARDTQHQFFVSMVSRNLYHVFYDIETDFHRNTLQQQKWDSIIKNKLALLAGYSATAMELELHN